MFTLNYSWCKSLSAALKKARIDECFKRLWYGKVGRPGHETNLLPPYFITAIISIKIALHSSIHYFANG